MICVVASPPRKPLNNEIIEFIDAHAVKLEAVPLNDVIGKDQIWRAAPAGLDDIIDWCGSSTPNPAF